MIGEKKKAGWKTLRMGAVMDEPGSSTKFKTGDWRAFRPIKDDKKCTKCMLCWVFCPEPAISATDLKIDYDFCKGCGICAAECPVKAITMMEEVRTKTSHELPASERALGRSAAHDTSKYESCQEGLRRGKK